MKLHLFPILRKETAISDVLEPPRRRQPRPTLDHRRPTCVARSRESPSPSSSPSPLTPDARPALPGLESRPRPRPRRRRPSPDLRCLVWIVTLTLALALGLTLAPDAAARRPTCVARSPSPDAIARPALLGRPRPRPTQSPDARARPALPGPGVFLALARLSLKPTRTSHLSPASVLEAVNPAFCQVLPSPSPDADARRRRPTCVARSPSPSPNVVARCPSPNCVARSWSFPRPRSPVLEADEDVAPQPCERT